MGYRFVIAGSSGLIGSRFVTESLALGDSVVRLVRTHDVAVERRENLSTHFWDPQAGVLDPAVLETADAVVCLSGASIGRIPWTRSYQQEIMRSRFQTTTTLVQAFSQLKQESLPMFLSASAVGYYGHAPGVQLTEESPGGKTFLAQVCKEWERRARVIEDLTPVAILRTAPLLDPKSVLGPLIRLSRLGLAGPLGNGKQIWPWISSLDHFRAMRYVLEHRYSGPINFAGPTSATQNDIGRALAQALQKPYLLPAPAWALQAALGKAASSSLLLCDADVKPKVLLESGFEFIHARVEDAISDAIKS